MSIFRNGPAALLLLTGTSIFSTAAFAAPACKPAGAAPLEIGQVTPVAAGRDQNYTIDLKSGEGIIVDLDGLTPRADDDTNANAAIKRTIALCNARGEVLAPLPSEVFAKGGSITTTSDGARLRFVAQSSGQYLISVAKGEAPREIIARRRNSGAMSAPSASAAMGSTQNGVTSSAAPVVFSFPGQAGQWVEIKSTSSSDTLLRLAAPDRKGEYSVIAENDDTDGFNPVIRRKLPSTGTYYVQVDALSDEAANFTLTIKPTAAPKPPAPPVALRLNSTVNGRLADGDDAKIYSLAVAAGQTYTLELTAPYDGVVAIGLADPIEPEDGNETQLGFAEIRSQDSGVTGTEKLTFTARNSGQLLVRVRSFGIDETDGRFTLTATSLNP